MSRKKPVSEESQAPEGSAPEATEKPKRENKKFETAFQKVTRRLARAKRAYEKLPEAEVGDEEAVKLRAKAKQHLDGCVARYAKVADPQPEQEVAEPQAA